MISLIGAGLWSFIELADYAGGDEPSSLDRHLLLALRSPSDPADALGPPWFEEFVRDLTAVGGLGPLALTTLVVLGYLVLDGRARAAAFALAWIACGILLSTGLKELFDRPRPDVVPHLMHVSTRSFPSGHAMLSTVVYVTLGSTLAPVQRGRLRAYVLAVAVSVAVVVGCSRVYLGVHWPSDVAAGFAGGTAWAGLGWLIQRRLRRDGSLEPEPPETGEDSA